MPNDETKFRCTVKKIFKNCPKSDGWYGFFAHVPKLKTDVKITGITSLRLKEQMQLDITAIPDPKSSDAFIMKDVTIVTQTQKGIVAYLSSFDGIGRFTAERIVNEFGINAVSEIENNIDHVKQICCLSDRQADILKNNISATNETNRLQKFLPELTLKQIEYVKHHFTDPVTEITDNPYRLCEEVPGIGFAKADAVALRLGFDNLSPFRVNHGIVHVLRTAVGICEHSYVNLSDNTQFAKLFFETQKLLNIQFQNYTEFADRLKRLNAVPSSPIRLNYFDKETHLYLYDMYMATETIRTIVKSSKPKPSYSLQYINHITNGYEQAKNLRLTTEQKNAVTTALQNNFSVITGGPGRGKTMLIDCITMGWDCGNVFLLAPTGKAANKLSTATNNRYSTMTIDKFVILASAIPDKNKNGSPNNLHNLIVVDESSMIDVRKAASLLACCPYCSYVFVGDIDQLPPIEPGTFFKDLIESNAVPVARLTVPMRNKGKILENADKINVNDINLSYDFVEMPFFPYPNEDQQMLDAIIDRYNEERKNTPDITQIALLSPMHKGFAGTVKLNITIQDIACPAVQNVQPSLDKRRKRENYVQKGFMIPTQMYGNSSDYTKYRVGDIVMNTKNQPQLTLFSYTNNDYWNGSPQSRHMGIFNGDCGTIIAYVPASGDQDEIIVIQLFDGKIAEINCSAGEFESFSLGYAMTVHKAQGCEYETVIYVSPASMINCVKTGFASKNIIYTAVTRAKSRMIIMGSKEGLNACIRNNLPVRNSKLAQKLQN